MKIAVLKERSPGETRVAITPEVVRKFVKLGITVAVEADAGFESYISDDAFTQAGAIVFPTVQEMLNGTDVLLCVRTPEPSMLTLAPQGTLLVGMLDPFRLEPQLPLFAASKLTAFAMELLPRISRAQSMDVLSSQSNLAGYRAVIDAVQLFTKAIPMMMTAAGTIAPAKALVLGAGVAGLQAIATAKRLGAVVSAFDVRPAVKEQVESLGAKFVEVPAEETAETKGGYAREMSEEYKARQRQLIHDTIIKQDIVISTALIPGKPAPVLITEEMVAGMRPGSIIVDLAAASGGNCPLTRADEVIAKHGVTIVGYTNFPARLPVDASALYAKNLFNFVSTLLADKEGHLSVQWEDELIKGTLLTKDGVAIQR